MLEDIKNTLWTTADKLRPLTEKLVERMANAEELDLPIRKKPGGLSYEV